MAISVVYFSFTHRLGRPHYMWDEYLYSVLEVVEVRVTVYAVYVLSIATNRQMLFPTQTSNSIE